MRVPGVALQEFSRTAAVVTHGKATVESLAAREHIACRSNPLKRFALRPHKHNAIQAWERKANRIARF